MALQRRIGLDDQVKAQGKLVVQVQKERICAKEWEKNWGFLKDMRLVLEEEAAKHGFTKEEYWAAVESLKPRYIPRQSAATPHPSADAFPITTSGMIGWRCKYPLDLKNPPGVPKLPSSKPQNFIFLG